MIHLDICNTSYGKKKGREFNCLTSDHKKSGIDPTFVRAGGVRQVIGKLSMKVATFL
jgi:hypothetical protein